MTHHLLQLSPSIPVITPRGPARAVVLIDYGEDHDLVWVCFQDAGGECWSWRNRDVRAVPNITFGVTSARPTPAPAPAPREGPLC